MKGATGRIARDFAVHLVKAGWHVTVITSGPHKGERRDKGVRIIMVKGAEKPSGMRGYIWVWLKMFFCGLRQSRRHVIITMSDPPLFALAGALLSKLKRCRHVNWCQDVYPEVLPALGMKPSKISMGFLKMFRRMSMRMSDRVIVCGRCMRDYLIKDGLREDKIAFVANWPELELTEESSAASPFTSPAEHETIARPFASLKKERQRFRVLYAGNIGLAHPVNIILDAAQRLQAQARDIEFVFVGDGARFDYIAQARAQRHLDNIRLLPYQPLSRLRDVLESGDLHIVSLRGEAAGFVVPSKLYATLAVGRPCLFIGPTGSETARVIGEFKCGLVIPQSDVEHLIASIILYRKNGDAWFEAHQGALRARELFKPQVMMEQLKKEIWAIVKDDLRV